MAAALEVVPAGEPWEACPLPPEAGAPQSARAAPRPGGSGAAGLRLARLHHVAWRTAAAQDVLARLRSHCARCEVTAEVRRACRACTASVFGWTRGTATGSWPGLWVLTFWNTESAVCMHLWLTDEYGMHGRVCVMFA